MSDPCPAPAGFAWGRFPLGRPGVAWALCDRAGARLFIVEHADAWVLHGPDGTILRDAVSAERLPVAIEAALNPTLNRPSQE